MKPIPPKSAIRAAWFAAVFSCTGAFAELPVITSIHPDFPVVSPRIITGENFATGKVEVYVWNPPRDEAATARAAGAGAAPTWPTNPPPDARKIAVLSAEERVIAIGPEEQQQPFAFVWVKNETGFSKPVRTQTAAPFWLQRDTVPRGSIVGAFGVAMSEKPPIARIALRGQAGTVLLDPIVAPLPPMTPDTRMIYFQVPENLPTGSYEVLFHNALGGAYGWSDPLPLTVLDSPGLPPPTINVQDFGAKGDGMANDTSAINAAIAKAGSGGGVVSFPPGTYLFDETILLPEGVTLRGAGRDSTILRGVGYYPPSGVQAWWSATSVSFPLIGMTNSTALERLTLRGAVSKGEPNPDSSGAVYANALSPIMRDVEIRECRIEAGRQDPVFRSRYFRSTAFNSRKPSEHITLVDNELIGGVNIVAGDRIEVRGNVIQGGISSRFSRSLICSNVLTSPSSRLFSYAGRENLIRYNETFYYFRDSWINRPEAYMMHGGASTVAGMVGASASDSLIDPTKNWKVDQHVNATVLIGAGRGFGQIRRVVQNTMDTLKLDRPWVVQPDASSEYSVGPAISDCVFFSNVNYGVGRFTLWLDCHRNTVEGQVDVLAGVRDIWGRDLSRVEESQGGTRKVDFPQRLSPSWFNTFLRCVGDGSGIVFEGMVHPSRAYRTPVLFANFAIYNEIRLPHLDKRPYTSAPSLREAAIVVGEARGKLLSASDYAVVFGNSLRHAKTGIFLHRGARKTVLGWNSFETVESEVIDKGSDTLAIKGGGPTWSGSPGEDIRVPEYDASNLPTRALRLLRPFMTHLTQESLALADPAQSPERLRRLFPALKEYAKAKGWLPRAAAYPESADSSDNLLGLLGAGSVEDLTAGYRGARLKGWPAYLWNASVGGRTLEELSPDTWLLVEPSVLADWLAARRQQPVLALYADGTVRALSEKLLPADLISKRQDANP